MNLRMKINKNFFYVIFTLLYYIIIGALVNFFGVNKMFLYLGDVFNIVLFMYTLLYAKKTRNKVDNKVICLMLIIVITGIFSNLINFNSSFLLAWGIRNTGRFFMYFYSCSILLKPENYETIFKVVKIKDEHFKFLF